MKFILSAASALALIGAAPVHAQEAMEGETPSAARLAAADEIAGYLLPDGTYAKIMNSAMDQVMTQVMDSMMDIPVRDLAGIAGLSEEELAERGTKLGDGTMREMMAILDPHFLERQEIMMQVMMSGMVDIMSDMEPAMRDGLGEAYANRFAAEELATLNRFFATPVGRKYAASAMLVFTDPAVMAKMQDMVPTMMQAMPGLMQEVKQATADLPPPRSVDDLSEAERARLAELLGTDPAEMDNAEAE